jgi:hypothetical protein
MCFKRYHYEKDTKKSKVQKVTLRTRSVFNAYWKGERLYKFYYFRPMAGRRENFEYQILTKEKADGMLEMVSYNFKNLNGVFMCVGTRSCLVKN